MLTLCLLQQVGGLKQEISELDAKIQEADRLLKASQLTLHHSGSYTFADASTHLDVYIGSLWNLPVQH
jgi:hypothetical protein